MKLDKSFFEDNTVEVAKKLLGKVLTVREGRKVLRGVITETEAYRGEDDLACHASKGRTKRTETLYKEAGTVYVYMIYGMYFCLNIVTEKADYPSAVLIRGVIPLEKNENEKSITVDNLWKTQPTPARHASQASCLAGVAGGCRVGMGLGISGPGRVCRYFGIDKRFNGLSVEGGDIWVEDVGIKVSSKEIVAGKRVGVDYAKHCKDYLWRFNLL